jgi:hypothetical protein
MLEYSFIKSERGERHRHRHQSIENDSAWRFDLRPERVRGVDAGRPSNGSFAHVYDTGGMRRTHLRGHTNILKRILIHVSGFNLGLIMRQLIGVDTPRGLQGRPAVAIAALVVLISTAQRRLAAICAPHRRITAMRGQITLPTTIVVNSSTMATYATGC